MKRKQLFITLFLACCVAMQAKEYHVSIKGNDANEGTEKAPFRTIGKAAEYAFPGDIITVHAGTYREWVNPPRGGESDDKRIVYRAAPGEKVEIKGSERITNWTKEKNGVWKVTIPNTFFGDYNPYIDLIYGDWFEGMGREHHTGEVFLNNKSLYEKETLDKVLTPVGTRTVYPLFPSSFDRGCRLIHHPGRGRPLYQQPLCHGPSRNEKDYKRKYGLADYNKTVYPMMVDGNVYYNGALPFEGEKNKVVLPDFKPDVKVEEMGDGVYLSLSVQGLDGLQTSRVTTERLGKAKLPRQAYEQPDGSPIDIATDYLGNARGNQPKPGPLESIKDGAIRIKVW